MIMHTLEAKMEATMLTGKTTSPDTDPTDNFTDTDPFLQPRLLKYPAKVSRSESKKKRVRTAYALKQGVEYALVVLFLLAIACCRMDSAVEWLFCALLGLGGLYAAVGAWLWVEWRTL